VIRSLITDYREEVTPGTAAGVELESHCDDDNSSDESDSASGISEVSGSYRANNKTEGPQKELEEESCTTRKTQGRLSK